MYWAIKTFWQIVKLYFSDKSNFANKIMISGKGYTVSNDRRLSEIFNEHITKNLDLKPNIVSTTVVTETFKGCPYIFQRRINVVDQR